MCAWPAPTNLRRVAVAVFVHDVLETEIVWDPLREALSRDSLALTLPGFGAPMPTGFKASKDDYASWLEAELRTVTGPVDLVGHGFGAVLCLRLVTGFDSPVRSWAVDVANVFHRDYGWHRTARTWQTPGAGEEALARLRADVPGGLLRGAARLERIGAPPTAALEMSAAHDRTTTACTLSIYRSTHPNVRADWHVDRGPDSIPPGLIIFAAADPLGDERLSDEVASELGASKVRLDDLGHMWMLEHPDGAARVLERFWASL
jgi:pimeloyl-ACP methyl ester carboxylesterase